MSNEASLRAEMVKIKEELKAFQTVRGPIEVRRARLSELKERQAVIDAKLQDYGMTMD